MCVCTCMCACVCVFEGAESSVLNKKDLKILQLASGLNSIRPSKEPRDRTEPKKRVSKKV